MYLPNKSLHWTGIPLRSIPASELGRLAEKNKLHVYGILKQGGRLKVSPLSRQKIGLYLVHNQAACFVCRFTRSLT